MDILDGTEENEEWAEEPEDYLDHAQSGVSSSASGKGKGPERLTSAVDVLLQSIQGFISNLMSLSILIRSSAPRDDYLKAASRYAHLISGPDKSHVWEKFGKAKYTQPWLLDSLGEAITIRRRFLLYRTDHHNRMMGEKEKANAVAMNKDARTVVASTKATTFFVGENAIQHVRATSPDFGGSFGSATSYEPTIFEGEEKVKKLSVPPPPEEAFPGIQFKYEEPFQCPYCYTEQVVKDKNDWKYANPFEVRCFVTDVSQETCLPRSPPIRLHVSKL